MTDTDLEAEITRLEARLKEVRTLLQQRPCPEPGCDVGEAGLQEQQMRHLQESTGHRAERLATPAVETRTLGDRLRQLQAEARQRAAQCEQDAANAAAAQSAKERTAVATFFEEAKAHITASLESGVLPTPFQLGQSPSAQCHMEAYNALRAYQSDNLNSRLANEREPYNLLLRKFCAWAEENGLRPIFSHEHDGVGIHGWYVLDVKPR